MPKKKQEYYGTPSNFDNIKCGNDEELKEIKKLILDSRKISSTEERYDFIYKGILELYGNPKKCANIVELYHKFYKQKSDFAKGEIQKNLYNISELYNYASDVMLVGNQKLVRKVVNSCYNICNKLVFMKDGHWVFIDNEKLLKSDFGKFGEYIADTIFDSITSWDIFEFCQDSLFDDLKSDKFESNDIIIHKVNDHLEYLLGLLEDYILRGIKGKEFNQLKNTVVVVMCAQSILSKKVYFDADFDSYDVYWY